MRINRKMLLDVGLFVAVGIGVSMVVVFFIGRERSLFERRYTLVAPFKNISGLRMGAVVQLAGLNVGYVDGVRFPKQKEVDYLDVILKINTDFKDRIRKDSKASIQTQGLLGDKFISITTGSAAAAELKEGDVLITGGVGGVQALAESGQELIEDIRQTAKKFQQTLDRLPLEAADQASMRQILWNVEAITGDWKVISSGIRRGEGSVGAILQDPALYHDLRALMGHANRNKLLKTMIRATVAEQEKATTRPVKEEN